MAQLTSVEIEHTINFKYFMQLLSDLTFTKYFNLAVRLSIIGPALLVVIGFFKIEMFIWKKQNQGIAELLINIGNSLTVISMIALLLLSIMTIIEKPSQLWRWSLPLLAFLLPGLLWIAAFFLNFIISG